MDRKQVHIARRRGISLVWAVCTMSVTLGMASLAVDFGRVQSARAEMQASVDNATRYGATAWNQYSDQALSERIRITRVRIAQALRDNRIDGDLTRIRLGRDVDFGTWNATTGVFTELTGDARANANALRVDAVYGDDQTEGIETYFAGLIGMNRIKLNVDVVVAMPGVQTDSGSTTVDAKSNVWFAGLPSGQVARTAWNDYTYQTESDADEVTTVAVTPGAVLEFNATGNLSNVPWTYNNTPDGDGWVCNNVTDNLGGKSNCLLPINAVMGVFLGPDDPRNSPAPPDLDFSSQASRDYLSLSPQLKQTFFIGDGRTSGGVQQRIVVPPGATRLYLGSMDPWGWWNNAGTAVVNIRQYTSKPTLVK
jgi:Putative Flp pilus-assembly TadE/G-like